MVGGGHTHAGLRRFVWFALVSLLTRGYLVGVAFLSGDEAAHLLGSWTLLDGGRLYVDFIDNKPPLVYVYYALCQLVLGRGSFAVHLVTVMVTVPLIALAMSAWYRHDRRGTAAALAWLVFGAAFDAADVHAANCELLALLPMTWGLAALAAGRPSTARALWSGVLLGVAAGCKQQALLVPVAAAAALVMGRAAVAAGALAVGFAGALAAIWLCFVAADSGGALVYWALTYNLLYVNNPILLEEAIRRLLFGLGAVLAPSLPLLLGTWWSRRERSPELRLARLAALATVPAVFVGWRFYGHYFMLLQVPLALAAAPWLARVWWAPPQRAWARRWLVAAALVATMASIGGNLWGYALGQGPKTSASARIADWLRADRCSDGASLFVWGTAAQVYARSELAPATRFVLPQATISGYVFGNDGVRRGHVSTHRMIDDAHRKLLIADLVARPPTYVVDLSGHSAFGWEQFPLQTFPALEALVSRSHEVVANIDGARILGRRDCAAPPAASRQR